MFLVWAIPLGVLAILLILVPRYALRGRVESGEREPGRTLFHEEDSEED